MQRFFNRIRKQLAKDNKFFQYSRYAIGEILLVVIGILIALQVNNWNGSQKEKQLAKEYIRSLRADLISDITLIKSRYPMVLEWLEDSNQFKQKTMNPNLTTDSLIKIARSEFVPARAFKVPFQQSTITALLSTGQIRLVPKELADEALNYYAFMDKSEEHNNYGERAYAEALTIYLEKYSIEAGGLASGPLLQELIWNDVDPRDLAPRLSRMINLRIMVLDNSKWQYDELLTKATDLIEKLNTYLKN